MPVQNSSEESKVKPALIPVGLASVVTEQRLHKIHCLAQLYRARRYDRALVPNNTFTANSRNATAVLYFTLCGHYYTNVFSASVAKDH